MEKLFLTTANDEQKRAIFHHGGVLLSAGAGSGKTFVLVEHIAFLIWDHRQNHLEVSRDDYISLLKQYMATVVLMTFTKKAAGELAIRLKSKMAKLEQASEEENDQWLWQQASLCLDSMTVGTIDGFCYKLITQGFFPTLPVEMSIVSDLEVAQKITALYDEWLDYNLKDKLDKIEGVEAYFVHHREEFIVAFKKIFTTPELRLVWRELTIDQMLDYSWDDFCEIVFGDFHPKKIEQLIPYEIEAKKGAWVEKLEKLKAYFATPRDWHKKDFFDLYDFLSQDRKLVSSPPRIDEVKTFFNAIKDLRDVLDKVADDLIAYDKVGKSILKEQCGLMLDAFSWMENRYSQVPGFTFADLEYYVSLGLKDEEARKNISNRYRYLIVDEFQDTSRIQYDIIVSIIGRDFSRLFCVGDEKQAIYGFRGGELAVFKDCKKSIPLNLELANNYRSQGNVIDFNNALFADLFRLGKNYEGLERHPVDVVAQKCPIDDRLGKGEVVKISGRINLLEKEKVTESAMVEIEADQIFKYIKNTIHQNESEEICVLYKGLKPSISLMAKLIGAGVGLRAQVKIAFPEDPLLALFTSLVQGLQLSYQKGSDILKTPTIFFAQKILEYLKIQSLELHAALTRFEENVGALGLVDAFGDFLFEMGVSNSNHSGNMAEIERLCSLSSGDLEVLLTMLDEVSSQKYSIEFQSPGIGQVVIMTAHASKGLQFSHIILGGIHANGRSVVDREIVGKEPGSLLWRSSQDQKKKHKSPQMIMEQLVGELKEFSESKRLFYVACTRAENKLSWIDLSDSNGKQLSYNKDSWINGIRTFETNPNNISSHVELFEHIKSNGADNEIEFASLPKLDVSVANIPMFHLDPLGIVGHEVEPRSLVVFPELSVTKLATITQCSRKFYLSHICKLEAESFDERKLKLEDTKIDSEEIVVHSSAKRGTLVHEAIAYGVDHHGVISLELQKQIDQTGLESAKWALSLINDVKGDYELFSERSLKFDFFGQMISGTPDLFMLPKSGDQLRLIDFKTGRPHPQKEVPYWFQLQAYAHAINTIYGKEHKFKSVSIELWYVDVKKIEKRDLNFDEIDQKLHLQWSKLARPFAANLEHCSHCSFGKICHPV